jgi:hypothetical protein
MFTRPVTTSIECFCGAAIFIDWDKLAFFVKPGFTDMRKQINGLSILAETEMQQNMFSGNLFIRSKIILNVRYWGRSG